MSFQVPLAASIFITTFPRGVSFFQMSDRLGDFTQLIGTVDDGRDSAGLHEIVHDDQVLLRGLRDERNQFLVHEP